MKRNTRRAAGSPPRVPRTVRVDKDLWDAVRVEAERRGETVTYAWTRWAERYAHREATMSDYDPELIEKAAQAIYNALADDDTHITPGVGVDPETIAARAVLDAVADDLRAEAWDKGYAKGYSFGDAWAQDTYDGPVEDPTTNPYRKEVTDDE